MEISKIFSRYSLIISWFSALLVSTQYAPPSTYPWIPYGNTYYSYKGVYSDTSYSLIPNGASNAANTPAYSVEWCLAICYTTTTNTYIAVEGSVCLCGPTLNLAGNALQATTTGATSSGTCIGDPFEYCGATGFAIVYERHFLATNPTGVTPFISVGDANYSFRFMYTDLLGLGGLTSGITIQQPNMHVEYCLRLCYQSTNGPYAYAAVEQGSICRCAIGFSTLLNGIRDNSQAISRCAGNVYQRCGALNLLQVYALNSVVLTTLLPSSSTISLLPSSSIRPLSATTTHSATQSTAAPIQSPVPPGFNILAINGDNFLLEGTLATGAVLGFGYEPPQPVQEFAFDPTTGYISTYPVPGYILYIDSTSLTHSVIFEPVGTGTTGTLFPLVCSIANDLTLTCDADGGAYVGFGIFPSQGGYAMTLVPGTGITPGLVVKIAYPGSTSSSATITPIATASPGSCSIPATLFTTSPASGNYVLVTYSYTSPAVCPTFT